MLDFLALAIGENRIVRKSVECIKNGFIGPVVGDHFIDLDLTLIDTRAFENLLAVDNQLVENHPINRDILAMIDLDAISEPALKSIFFSP